MNLYSLFNTETLSDSNVCLLFRVLSLVASGAAQGGAVNVTCGVMASSPGRVWVEEMKTSCEATENAGSLEGGWTHYLSPGIPETQAELGHEDGIVMTILHQVTGSVLLTKTFNTWHPYTHAHDLKWWVEKVEAGRVIVLSVRRAGTYGLGPAIHTITHLGSLLVQYAPPLSLWVWVFVVRGKTLLESLAPSPHPLHSSLAALHTHTLTPAVPALSWPPGLPPMLVQLCNSHAVLGSFCDTVEHLVFPSMAFTGNVRKGMMGMKKGMFGMEGVENTGESVVSNRKIVLSQEGVVQVKSDTVGVVLSAGGRLQYLAHTLRQLLQASHVLPHRVLVVVGTTPDSGNADPDVVVLLQALRLNYRVVDVPPGSPSMNHRLFQYYRRVWELGVETFPHASYLAFLDEDVEVSRDWLALLLHLAPALEKDPSLWCVSGTSAAHIAIRSDPRLVTRGSRQPGWGFLVLAKDARKAVARWPRTSSVSVLYDTFLYTILGHGRECLFPVLSRARHYGVGVNTLPEIHHFYFLERPLHDGSFTVLPPPSDFTRDRFEARVWNRLSAAVPLTTDPCAPGFIPITSSHDVVFFFYLESLTKSSLEWTLLAECVGAWPYSTQGLHQGSVELPQAWGGSLWLVGVPASPYHILKPSHIHVWRLAEEDGLKQQQFFMETWRPRPILSNKTIQTAASHLFVPLHVGLQSL
ncbi:hypothetical protein Pmani_004747 [Petrolisthes manimaculis]|uniref:ILEI/PANDER domain-containing protein n=1 Tax=Petrolisthes manimaculis TaxID=1843537 RepID=A0AAE1UMZ2_9EUCA|nr:hypothetical protein Pmani_004747 [Petrolisthes manimaculis]